MDTMCYFNNAATSFPKPECVKKSVMDFFTHPPINSSRHCNCIKKSTDIDVVCKQKIREYFSIGDNLDLILTPSATYSANIAIDSLHNTKSNLHLITNNWCHNSILRTHYEKIGTKPIIIKDINNILDYDLEEDKNYYVALSQVNNVDGSKILDTTLKNVIEYCKKYNIPLILDITQSAGTFNINISNYDYNNIYVICSCHKGMYSLQGIGFLVYPKNSIESHLISGGSGGVNSIDYKHTDTLEPGTQNEIAICSLVAGIDFLIQKQLDNIKILKSILYNYFINKYNNFAYKSELSKIFQLVEHKDTVCFYSGIICFKILDKNKSDFLIQRLTDEYNIITRSGVHCTPLYHINELRCDSTWRISFGIHNTKSEIDYLFDSLSKLLRT